MPEIRAPGCGQGIAACVDTWFGTSKFDVIHFSEPPPPLVKKYLNVSIIKKIKSFISL